jgi:UDP-N-acetylmuramoyl-tripeptide--D-alanyl-D-alanine ligase
MTAPLWSSTELQDATRGTWDGHAPVAITGISIDTRSLAKDELFVALRDNRDGHEFVTTAFKVGAAAALVSAAYVRQSGDKALLRVDDPLRALEDLGHAARARLSPDASIIAVTGSVGKTTTKEMLRACLWVVGRTHAADKSFNNHWGVPLTLARMPRNTQYGVFEIGMNHAGEITPLTLMVRPHVAIVTTVEAVHLEHFATVADIAKAKAEIFEGLEEGGTAVIPADNPHVRFLDMVATNKGAVVDRFGSATNANTRLQSVTTEGDTSKIACRVAGQTITYLLAAPGAHMVQNSLAVAATLVGIGLDPQTALRPLATFGAPTGRGSRTAITTSTGPVLLIDESYNANPASMRAALAAMADLPRATYPRRIAVLGDMLELGDQSDALHAGLVDALLSANIDLVVTCGPHMARLHEGLPFQRRGAWAATSEGIRQPLLELVRGGDVVMIKGSNGSRMGLLVSALTAKHSSNTAGI